MTRRYVSMILFALIVIHSQAALRFADEEMMKTHHKEKYQKNGPVIIVHLIPHSHDDVGWLKTVDDYYYGGDMRTQFAGVQYTIDTVVSELAAHPEYKFSIVEMAFLYRWWNQATNTQRQQMKALVANGQIEFINGGWCMSDEATMYYEDFIDQMTVGLRWLKETFNVVPSVAWHIDPFGHHSSSASLFSRMGFQAFFFARIDYQDKEVRLQAKTMEMVWRPVQFTGEKSNYIFTHVNYYHYSAPPGFCFDDVCRDDPIKDDRTLQGYNLDARSQNFVDYFKSMAMHFRTTNLLHTLGEDFQFTNARMYYKNIDKLLKYINDRPEFGVNIQYSTPSKYLDAIQKEKASYPIKNDDFFPYADHTNAFWTGYFVSRVALKGFVRDFGRYLQATRKHISELKISNASNVIRNNGKTVEQKIFGMEMAMGILQHHDAVAGTAKQRVTNDYVATGLRTIYDFNKFYSDIKTEEINNEVGEQVSSQDLYFNLFWNETGQVTGLSAKLKANKTVLVSLYNPGAKGIYPIRLKVPSIELNIVSQSNNSVAGDVICGNLQDTDDCEVLFSLPFEESSNAYVKLVPVKSGGSAKVEPVKQLTITEQIKIFKLGDDSLRITRGNQTFDLTINGVTESFKIGYNYYEGFDSSGQDSGAYIFRPISNIPKQYSSIKRIYYCDASNNAIVILQGDRTTTRVYFSKSSGYVKNYGFLVETFVDSIPVTDLIGKEVTLNFKTNYANNKTFWTDSMGLQEQKRVLDYRPTWNYTVNEPVSGNYYPINGFIQIQDTKTNKKLTIINDRSQGGTVMKEGEIQIMIHRRLLKDDGRGVGEPLNELDTDGKGLRQTVRHYVLFGGDVRLVQKWNDQRILPVFASTSSNTFAKATIRKAPISVPEEIKLNLRPFEDGSYLVRVHNMNPRDQSRVTFGSEWKATEYTLAANQLLDDWKKKQMTWNEEKSFMPLIVDKVTEIFEDLKEIPQMKFDYMHNGKGEVVEDTTVTLLPFELKAFKVIKA